MVVAAGFSRNWRFPDFFYTGFAAGRKAFLAKPFTTHTVLDVVGKIYLAFPDKDGGGSFTLIWNGDIVYP